MSTNPEIKPSIETPHGLSEHGDLQKEAPAPSEVNIQPTPGPFVVQSQVPTQSTQSTTSDDSNIVTITVPATPQQLEDWAKGSPDNAVTWLAFYWIRMIKKALFHGWRVMTAAQPSI